MSLPCFRDQAPPTLYSRAYIPPFRLARTWRTPITVVSLYSLNGPCFLVAFHPHCGQVMFVPLACFLYSRG